MEVDDPDFIIIIMATAGCFVQSCSTTTHGVFQNGPYSTTPITVDRDNYKSKKEPPRSLFIVSPTQPDTYPVILFFHGWELHNTFYSALLDHIASHGFIIVAPQLFGQVSIYETLEIDYAGEVADWMRSNLEDNLPRSVLPNLSLVALAGHSRGGKTAFAIALGLSNTTQKFSALIGIDPVAGLSSSHETKPKILTHQPQSFNISIPIAVIGMGLPNDPAAPEGVNHDEFFKESKPPCAHFVAEKYGHMDMLDDDLPWIVKLMIKLMSKSGEGNKGDLRRSASGIVVAFLNAYFKGQTNDLLEIVKNPSLAPVKLDPVQYLPA